MRMRPWNPGRAAPSTYSSARLTRIITGRPVFRDMCAGIDGGPACVRACPTGAAIRVAPDEFLTVARLEEESA